MCKRLTLLLVAVHITRVVVVISPLIADLHSCPVIEEHVREPVLNITLSLICPFGLHFCFRIVSLPHLIRVVRVDERVNAWRMLHVIVVPFGHHLQNASLLPLSSLITLVPYSSAQLTSGPRSLISCTNSTAFGPVSFTSPSAFSSSSANTTLPHATEHKRRVAWKGE